MTDTGTRRIVVGIGNPDRGDDAAGRAVARMLHGTIPPEVEIVQLDGETASLLACLDGAAVAYLIDACASGAPPGSVRRFDVGAERLPHDGFAMSTHGLGLAEAVELARALEQLPQHCIVYAIEAATFEAGAPLSPPVAVAVAELAARLRAEMCGVAAPGGRIDA